MSETALSLLPLKRNFSWSSFPQELKSKDQKIEGHTSKAPRICKDSSFPDDKCTLLKCVQYPGIDIDEQAEIEEEIVRIKANPSYTPEKYIQRLKLTGLDPGEEPLRAGPVFQVVSVRIVDNRDSSWNKMDIYGEISVTDDKGNIFFIYKRESGEFEPVTPQSNSLSLTRCPIAPLTWGNVKIDLYCKGSSSDVRIFAAEREVDYSMKDPSGDKNLSLSFFGEYGYYVLMEFNVIPFAFIAKVDMVFFMKDQYQPEEQIIDLDGQIKVDNVVCFQKQSFEFLDRYGIIEKSRNVFAVPVNTSHLLVEFLLHCGGTEFVKKSLKIDPGWLGRSTYYLDSTDEKFGFKIHVEWILHESFFNHENQIYQKHVKWSSHHLPMDYELDALCEATEPNTYVEVFSIFVGCNSSDRPLVVRGTILVQHRDETVYIFSRSKGCPDKLSKDQSQTLSLAWSAKEWVVEKDFHMNFKLKDFNGLPLCRGSLFWPDHWDCYASGYDRRKCDVIRGENGYFAAVHYSIFRNGKKAKVTIEYKGPYRHLLVYGSIFAEYDNYDYHSTYNQDYYRIIIFKRSKEDQVKVKNLFEIPLSKSKVSAPSDCKELTVDVKLAVCPSTASPDQILGIRLPFKAGRNDVFNLHGVNHNNSHLCPLECRKGPECVKRCITVKVEWP